MHMGSIVILPPLLCHVLCSFFLISVCRRALAIRWGEKKKQGKEKRREMCMRRRKMGDDYYDVDSLNRSELLWVSAFSHLASFYRSLWILSCSRLLQIPHNLEHTFSCFWTSSFVMMRHFRLSHQASWFDPSSPNRRMKGLRMVLSLFCHLIFYFLTLFLKELANRIAKRTSSSFHKREDHRSES